jgi:hypothetical protein
LVSTGVFGTTTSNFSYKQYICVFPGFFIASTTDTSRVDNLVFGFCFKCFNHVSSLVDIFAV